MLPAYKCGEEIASMGVREQPITRKMIYGRLRRYTCRVCGLTFKDYYLPEEKRICTRCTLKREGDNIVTHTDESIR